MLADQKNEIACNEISGINDVQVVDDQFYIECFLCFFQYQLKTS